MNNELLINNKKNLDINSNEITFEKQKNFLESNLGQAINEGLNFGIRAILPDMIEDDVIEIKDSIITDGFKAGVKTAIDNSIELGKSFIGIFTGKFENMSQVKEAVKKGGLIDSLSGVLDWGINKAEKINLINKTVSSIIKKGKNTILNTVNNNIENNITTQMESVEKIDKYILSWNEQYNNKDFNNMEKQFKKIEKELNQIMPLENVINRARVVENLHNLIKNNGKNFNLSSEEIELANKLI